MNIKKLFSALWLLVHLHTWRVVLLAAQNLNARELKKELFVKARVKLWN